jgi:hypothetical protein
MHEFSHLGKMVLETIRFRVVMTCVGLISPFYAIWVCVMRISQLLILVGYGYLTMVFFLTSFGSIFHARAFVSRQNRPSINMVFYAIDPNNNSCMQNILTFT